jgi:hypothetical protein
MCFRCRVSDSACIGGDSWLCTSTTYSRGQWKRQPVKPVAWRNGLVVAGATCGAIREKKKHYMLLPTPLDYG